MLDHYIETQYYPRNPSFGDSSLIEKPSETDASEGVNYKGPDAEHRD